MLCLRQYSQVAGPFLELVQSLRVLHLQPQRGLATEAPGDSTSSSSSKGQQGADQGQDLADSFNRKLADLQGGQSQADASAWLRANASRQQYSSNKQTPAGSSRGSFRAPAAGAGAGSSEQDGPSVQAHHEHGYAVLGGVDPSSSQQVAGAQQPKLHPTKNFTIRDMYNPTDLSPLAQEEEEPWVPQFNRGHRETPVRPHEVVRELDYKNIDFLLNFVSASGRIKPRRQTRLKPRLQSRVARTVKLARQMALIPYEMRVGEGGEGDTWRRMREFRAAERM